VPAAPDYKFPKPKRHHWPEQPLTLVKSKVNHPTLLVQDEGADYWYGDGPHGCEVTSRYTLSNTTASASWETPVFSLYVFDPLDVWHLSRINPNILYHNCFLFLYHTLSFQFVVSKWNNMCPCSQCSILFVWPRSRCVAFPHLVVSKNVAFQLYHNKQVHFATQCGIL
jgi:hypothetical protein